MTENANDSFDDNRSEVMARARITHSFYHDCPEEMTCARRIARYLSQYSWYFPNPNIPKSDER